MERHGREAGLPRLGFERMRVAVPALVAAFLLTLGAASAAQAATFTVNSTADTGDATPGDGACATGTGACTLRAAVQEANALAGADTIMLPAGNYVLTGTGDDTAAAGDLDVLQNLTIEGAGAASTTIDANNLDRIFHVPGPAVPLAISGVTLTRGKQKFGAAINTIGALTLTNSTLTGNTAGGSNDSGFGAVLVSPSAQTTLTIADSTFTGNTVGGGGAMGDGFGVIDFSSATPGTVEIARSTFSGNTVGGGNGAGFGVVLFSPSGAPTASTMTVTDTTFANNQLGGGGADGDAFGVIDFSSSAPGTLTVNGSRFRDNTVGGGGGSGFGVVLFSPSGAPTASTMTFTDASLTGNHVGGGASGSGFGVIDFSSSAPATGTVTRTVMTDNTVGGGGAGASGFGGLLFSPGGSDPSSLTVTDSTISRNTAGGGGESGFGAGIDFSSAAPATLAITGSTISGNVAGGAGGDGFGGGILFSPGSGAMLNVTNSTLHGNTAGGGAGGDGFGGGIDFSSSGGTATLTNSTISGNSSGEGAASAFGGGLFVSSGAASVRNTIISGNTKQGATNNCEAPVTSGGHNLEQGTTCGFTAAGDLNADPNLGPLADNGGPTQTRALLFGSPAIDAADNAACPLLDQRGFSRSVGPACDIGAFEFRPGTLQLSAASYTASEGDSAATITVDRTGGSDGTVTVDHATGGGTATAGSDYTATSGSLSLAGGETSKTFSVPILADTLDEPDETVDLALSNPGGGATLGSPANATLTITDDDPTPDTTPPELSALRLRPRSFRAANRGASITAPVGSTVRYSLSEAASVGFRVQRARPGRKVGRRCVRPTRSNRGRRPCTRWAKVKGSFTHAGAEGANEFRFSGRVGNRKLRPGRHRLLGTPNDTAGNEGLRVKARFRIVRR